MKQPPPIIAPGCYVTVSADPPWPFDDKLTMEETKRGAESNYSVMTINDICTLYRPELVLPDRLRRRPTLAGYDLNDTGFLFLWSTWTHLLNGSAQYVAKYWGYEPKQVVPWIKGRVGYVQPIDGAHGNVIPYDLILNMGMGRITRGVTEPLIICTRGRGWSKYVKRKNQNGLILDWGEDLLLESRGAHSAKPIVTPALIESLVPGPYVELFARRRLSGWTTWGNELPPHPDPGLEWPA